MGGERGREGWGGGERERRVGRGRREERRREREEIKGEQRMAIYQLTKYSNDVGQLIYHVNVVS